MYRSGLACYNKLYYVLLSFMVSEDRNEGEIMAKIAMKLFSRKQLPPHSRANGEKTSSKSKAAPRPLMLGVVGDSGCGKTTLVRGLKNLFGKQHVTEICLDDYHRYDRAERTRRQISALDPAANKMDLMLDDLLKLGQGQRVVKPVYDHSTGRFAHPEAITPRPIVVVHGLFTLFNPELAELFDLSVYLDPEEALRVQWKIARDTHRRGYSLEEVLHQIEERRADASAYICPQKQAADLTVSFRRPISLLYNTGLDVSLSPRAGWYWPRLQPDGTERWLTIPPGGALEISGRIDQPAAERLAHSFGPLTYPAYAAALKRGQPLKELGIYASTTENQSSHQSLPLALTQLLIAGRLYQPEIGLDEIQVA